MKVIGLMSGTSMDSIDASVVQITGVRHNLHVQLLGFYSYPYPTRIRQRMLLAAETCTAREICHLNALLGELFARAARRAIRKSGLSQSAIALIGSHGQTIQHHPQPVYEPRVGVIRSTLQIGDPAVIAERTGITTIADFRTRDLAAGGEGAPLTPYVHHLLFCHPRRSRLIVNLGGIANVTYLPSGKDLSRLQAFDTGPCNMLLDGLISHLTAGKQPVDRGGKLASQGQDNTKLLARLLTHSYFRKKPPKSTGREEFGQPFVAKVLQHGQRRQISPQNLLATCCSLIARTIGEAQQWLRGPIDEVVLGGGGIYNQALVARLSQVFSPAPVKPMDAYGWPSKAFEAVAFAVLAYQTVHGVCANVPAATGAKHPVLLGAIVPAGPTEKVLRASRNTRGK